MSLLHEPQRDQIAHILASDLSGEFEATLKAELRFQNDKPKPNHGPQYITRIKITSTCMLCYSDQGGPQSLTQPG